MDFKLAAQNLLLFSYKENQMDDRYRRSDCELGGGSIKLVVIIIFTEDYLIAEKVRGRLTVNSLHECV